jgi:tRNA threonylcarbamoyladenosine biosynthesis protein TsaB
MTLVLAVDTATPQVSVAVAGPDGPLASVAMIEGRRHGEVLAPAIETVCRLAGVSLSEIDLFAVDVGPGLFTGLRVGLATAGALAHGLGRPALGVTSTEVLAAAHRHAARPVAAVATPAELAAALAEAGSRVLSGAILAVGDGARRYAPELAGLTGVEVAGSGDAHPSAAVLAVVALGRAGDAGPAAALAPRYLREADVRIGWEQVPFRG